jgi:hypothetical protein
VLPLLPTSGDATAKTRFFTGIMVHGKNLMELAEKLVLLKMVLFGAVIQLMKFGSREMVLIPNGKDKIKDFTRFPPEAEMKLLDFPEMEEFGLVLEISGED